MKLDPKHIDRGKDEIREQNIAYCLENGILKKHPDDTEQRTGRKKIYTDEFFLAMFKERVKFNGSDYAFLKQAGLHRHLIQKGLEVFWTEDNKDKYDELYDELVEVRNVNRKK